MLRASATSSPIVCSAAETTVDSGAFATTMPRRVAASTSTLSTPTPARPITFSFDRAVDQLGGQLRRRADDDRVVAVDDLRELAVERRRRRRSASAAARRPPARSPRGRGRAVVKRLDACSYASSAAVTATPRSISAPRSASTSSTAASMRRDVEHVEPADVAEPEDLSLKLALAARDRHAETVAQRPSRRRRSRCPSGARTAVTTALRSSSGEKSSRPIAFDAGAARAAEPDVPVERGLEALLEQQPERDVERRRRATRAA